MNKPIAYLGHQKGMNINAQGAIKDDGPVSDSEIRQWTDRGEV